MSHTTRREDSGRICDLLTMLQHCFSYELTKDREKTVNATGASKTGINVATDGGKSVLINHPFSCLYDMVSLVDVWNMSMENWCNDTDRKTHKISEKPVSEPLCSPNVPHGLTWDRNRASAVRMVANDKWASYSCGLFYVNKLQSFQTY